MSEDNPDAERRLVYASISFDLEEYLLTLREDS